MKTNKTATETVTNKSFDMTDACGGKIKVNINDGDVKVVFENFENETLNPISDYTKTGTKKCVIYKKHTTASSISEMSKELGNCIYNVFPNILVKKYSGVSEYDQLFNKFLDVLIERIMKDKTSVKHIVVD